MQPKMAGLKTALNACFGAPKKSFRAAATHIWAQSYCFLVRLANFWGKKCSIYCIYQGFFVTFNVQGHLTYLDNSPV